jgi:hypothetical protein
MPRPYIPPPEAQWLDNLAATQIIADSEVAHCWVLVRVGIQTLKVGRGNLGELIEHLRAGNGMMLDELMIEVDATDAERALVGILDDQRSCSAAKLIVELERLAARAAGSSSTSPAGKPGGDAPRNGGSGSHTAAGDAPDLLGLLAGLLGTSPDRLSGDPAAYRAQVERVRAAAARWRTALADPASTPAARASAEDDLRALLAATGERAVATAASRTADLEATMRSLGADPRRISDALRMIADWLDQKTPAAGASVDRLIAALDSAAAPFLGRLTPAAAEAERDDRIREAARAAIAARMKPQN